MKRFLPLLLLALACPGPATDTTWDPAFDATSVGWLLSTFSPDGDVRYAVGGTPDAGVVYSDVTGDWAPVDTGLATPLLNWVFGFGPDDLWVVGNAGTIVHHDGASWATVDSGTTEDLWGIWGSGPTDLWAVGGSGFDDAIATLLHYDGAAWTSMELPELARPNVHALFKVWGSGPDDVFIVGQRGTLLRWNGSTLTEELVGTSEDLISVWGTGPDRVAVVGGRSNGIVVTWNGTEWHRESVSPLPGLNGVWMGDPDVIHAVGVDFVTATLDFETLAWTEDDITLPSGGRKAFHAVFGDAAGRLTTVGGNFASAGTTGTYEGIAYERELDD
ncbi:MAG: hypothetical protein CMN30_16880 [Sandaracinus sp.]|nr:hypothetical protein [Sandaracinus sp.]